MKIAYDNDLKIFEVYRINGFYQSRLCKRAMLKGMDLKEYLKSEELIKDAYDLTKRFFEIYYKKK